MDLTVVSGTLSYHAEGNERRVNNAFRKRYDLYRNLKLKYPSCDLIAEE